MKIHEHQAKELFKTFNIPVPDGQAAYSVAEATQIAEKLAGPVYVVKAQIHAGGRGKGGGVKIAKSIEEVREYASSILGMNLVTHQTGAAGKKVKRLLIEQGCEIVRELYLGMVLDRATGKIAVMASTEGGMEIEEVASKSPEKILKVFASATEGLEAYQARQLAYGLGLSGKQAQNAVKLIMNLFKLFIAKDCSLVEINPLVQSLDDKIIALDAKLNIDDNALYRQKDVENLRDMNEEDPMEIEAASYGLSYIKLDGSIGCLVNGAGLAMATMDTIKGYGGEPANFLDVGGGATAKQVANAFKIILSDKNVKAILVNIFGGIMRCDVIAEGIIEAANEIDISVPLVVRLGGTKMKEGRAMIEESNLKIISAKSLDEGAKKVVKLVDGGLS